MITDKKCESLLRRLVSETFTFCWPRHVENKAFHLFRHSGTVRAISY
jgi:hypothetical protein